MRVKFFPCIQQGAVFSICVVMRRVKSADSCSPVGRLSGPGLSHRSFMTHRMLPAAICRESTANFSPSSSRATNRRRSSILERACQGICGSRKAQKCSLCLRNELVPITQEGQGACRDFGPSFLGWLLPGQLKVSRSWRFDGPTPQAEDGGLLELELPCVRGRVGARISSGFRCGDEVG